MFRQFGWCFASVSMGCLLAGCDGSGGNYKSASQIKQEKEAAGHSAHDDEHGHGAGPHGGAIVELGEEEYHAEVVVDGKTHELRVYLLGPDAKTATPITATEATVITEDKKSLTLKASAQDGEAEGKASQFVLAEEEAVDALLKAGYLHGSLQLEIDGKPYRGDIDAHFDGGSHDDHADHKDGDHDDDKEMSPESEPSEDAPAGDATTDEPAETDKKAETEEK